MSQHQDFHTESEQDICEEEDSNLQRALLQERKELEKTDQSNATPIFGEDASHIPQDEEIPD
jgi:hypothetical protein